MSQLVEFTRETKDAVQSRLSDYLALLKQLVAIPSHATIAGGTQQVASEITPLLESLGYQVETVPQEALPDEAAWIERIMIPGQRQEDLGPTYVASKAGTTPESVLLLGDLDTAYPQDRHDSFPSRQEGSLLFGPGVADMKGGLVVMVAALQALEEWAIRTPSVKIVLASDEQAGSLGSRSVIHEVARECAWTLCVECARRGGKLMPTRGHIGIGDLTASGRESHAGSAYENGVNATDFLARVIPPVNELTRAKDGILVTVTLLEAGRRRSIIPDYAWGVLDIRTPNEAAWNETVYRIQQTVAAYGDGHVAARTYAHRPGVLWSQGTEQLLDIIKACGEAIDLRIDTFHSAAAGSTAFAAEAGSIVMDGMGPIGGGLMTPDEHVDTATIPERAAILAATLARLADPSLGHRFE